MQAPHGRGPIIVFAAKGHLQRHAGTLVVAWSCLFLLQGCAQASAGSYTDLLSCGVLCVTISARRAGTLARVLPHVAHGNAAAQAALLQHYAQSLDLEALDAAGAGTPQREVSPT